MNASSRSGSISSYRDLRVWQEGMLLAEQCYGLTRAFPREEMFGMTSQIRRSASSIPANVAEGYGRGSRKEYLQFLWIAQGSLNELETHLLLSERIGLTLPGSLRPVLDQTEQVGKMLATLIRALRKPLNPVP